MIQVNLLPKEDRPPEPRLTMQLPRGRVLIPLIIGGLVLIPVMGIYAIQQARIASLKADISHAEVEMRRLKPQIDRINQLVSRREALNLRLSVIQGLTRERYLPVQSIDRLAYQVPDYVWLTRVAHAGPGHIQVEGAAFSNLMIAELMSRLEGSDLFEGVTLVEARKGREGLGGDRPALEFTLTARLAP